MVDVSRSYVIPRTAMMQFQCPIFVHVLQSRWAHERTALFPSEIALQILPTEGDLGDWNDQIIYPCIGALNNGGQWGFTLHLLKWAMVLPSTSITFIHGWLRKMRFQITKKKLASLNSCDHQNKMVDFGEGKRLRKDKNIS